MNHLTQHYFNEFLKLTHQLTGVTISNNRISMLEGRIKKRMRALNISTFEEYYGIVVKDHEEEKCFINSVTTHETYFFRTPRIWDYFEKKFLPNWSQKSEGSPLKCWSAASASGEEAYSLGIICENFRNSHSEFNYQILGTDISQNMIQICKQHQYSGRSIEYFLKLKSNLFNKFMKKSDDECFSVDSRITQKIDFKTHNLFSKLISETQFDAIFLRNVLIYFKPEDQEKVLQNLHSHLSDHGVLIIGESETLLNLKTPFKQIEPMIYTKK